jgi:hypothetical protein
VWGFSNTAVRAARVCIWQVPEVDDNTEVDPAKMRVQADSRMGCGAAASSLGEDALAPGFRVQGSGFH